MNGQKNVVLSIRTFLLEMIIRGVMLVNSFKENKHKKIYLALVTYAKWFFFYLFYRNDEQSMKKIK
jgi:hypothetical protein